MTAVEWFVQQLEEYGSDDFKIIFKKQFEQAKAMEKEQIEMAYQADRYPCSDEDAEQYYKETYKN
jgi:spore coat protein CotF